jgi:anaphase-promoting complex subunit 11
MKFTITSYNAIATWKWDTSTEDHKPYYYAQPSAGGGHGEMEEEDDEEEEDDCGICRLAFESTCPECKVPGDDCPLSEFWVE